MTRYGRIALLGLLLATGMAAAKGDPEAGQTKAVACQACHGADGNSIAPIYPKLAGQYASYLVKALQDYRSGKRKNVVMAGFATTLSDQDIEDLAAYYAAMDSELGDLAD